MRKKLPPKSRKKTATQTRRSRLTPLASPKFDYVAAIVIATALAVVGIYLFTVSRASGPFVDRPDRGLIWAGLRTPHAGSKCGTKLLEATDSHGKLQGCTHGPDPAPAGVDVRHSVTPVTAAATAATTSTSSVGSELLIGCSGSNWSGTGSGPYRHTSGSADPLTCTITGGVTPGSTYQVSFMGYASVYNDVITPAIGDSKGFPPSVGTQYISDNIGAATASNPTFTLSSSTDTATINGISIKLVSAVNTIPCDGDGTSGPRIQALYVHASDVADRSAAFSTSFQIWANNVNNVFMDGGMQTGTPKSLRWVQDANCNPIVTDVTVSPTGDDTFGNTTSELRAFGYNRTDRKYLLLVDANVYCGLSQAWPDDQPGQANYSNTGPSYSRVDSGCWGEHAEAHELGHALGAVQDSAPHSTGGYHCSDGSDLMCYQDSSTVVMTYPCSAGLDYLDCNHDDYFNTNPQAGSYLATHWNIANSVFMFNGPVPPPPPSPPPPLPPPPPPPPPISVYITDTPTTSYLKISATTSDTASTVTKTEVYIDGVLKRSVNRSYISYSWYIAKVTGTHTIMVKAYDKAGNIGSSSVAYTK